MAGWSSDRPDLAKAWIQHLDALLLRRLSFAVAIFCGGLIVAALFEIAYFPERVAVRAESVPIQLGIAVSGLLLAWLAPRPGSRRIIAVGTFALLAAHLNGFQAVVGGAAESIAIFQVCILTGVAVLLLPSMRGQVFLSFTVLASFVLAAPYLTSSEESAFAVVGVGAGALVALAAATMLDRSARETFLQNHLLREEAEIAAALHRIGATLSAKACEPDLLDEVNRLAIETIRCDRSSCYLWNPDDCSFRLVAQRGFPPEAVRRTARIPYGPEASAAIERLESGELIEMSPSTRSVYVGSDVVNGPLPGFALFAPIRSERGLTGVVTFGFRDRTALVSPHVRRLIEGLAHAAAIALENARLIQEARAASRLKSDFVATMSHELRTPLNVILGYTGLLAERELGDLNAEQYQAIDATQRNALELLDLVSRVLDLSRIEAGQERVRRETFDFGALLREVSADVEALVPEGVRLSCACDPPSLRVSSDRIKVKTILKNLLLNALKFTDHGSVEVRVAAHGNALVMDIRDTGIGIAPEELPIIFEMFRQVDASLSRRHGGVGLGLHIVKRLVDLLGGAVSVESTAGEGSLFRVTLPQAVVEASPRSWPASTATALVASSASR